MADDTPERGADRPDVVTPQNGEPVPVSRADGKQLLGATWALLRQDKELIVLPLVGSVFGVVAAVILFIPGYGIGWLINGRDAGDIAYYAGAALAGIGATIIGVFFQAALVIGANERADGGDPTARSCLRGAWKHRWQILAWSVITATIGFVLQQIQERLGFLGWIVNWLGSIAWSIATFVVVPVLVAEDVGPVTAIKRSAQVLRDTWGTSLRTAARGGIIAFALWLVPLAVMVVGLVLLFTGDTVAIGLGVGLVIVAGVGLIVLGTLFSAVGAYARALIYRYAVGMPTPGIDDRVLAGAFRPK
ncbi:MAG: DUF6159 family protein [Aeromicrobium sp.]